MDRKDKLSVIIPVYNDYEKVKNLLPLLEEIKDEAEIIFSDASGDDRIRELLPEEYIYVKSEKGRGTQLNNGFLKSDGDIVLFIHCDSVFEKNIADSVKRAVLDGKTGFGCLSIYFDSDDRLMRICGYMSRFRAVKRKIAFGDQAMFFRRDVFEKLNMFSEIPIMEDYDISIRAKEKYSETGDKRFDLVQIDEKIISSSRKYYTVNGRENRGPFRFIGILKVMYKMQVYQKQFRKGVSAEHIYKEYYK